MNKTDQPILVYGLNRSGTKWLCNLLANHPDIAVVQSESTLGIMETDLFHVTPSKFDLTYRDDFAAFLYLWNQSSFVRQTEEDVTQYVHLDPPVCTESQLFQTLMDRFARRQGKSSWLQKSSPHGAMNFLAHIPARSVAIVRNLVDTVYSRQHMIRSQKRQESLISAVFGHVVEEKMLYRLVRRYGTHVVRYEDLKRDTRGTLQAVCRHLGVEFHESMLHARYRRNSSFSPSERQPPVAWTTKWFMIATAAIMRCVPWPILHAYAKVGPYSQRATPFVPGAFRELVESLGVPPTHELCKPQANDETAVSAG